MDQKGQHEQMATGYGPNIQIWSTAVIVASATTDRVAALVEAESDNVIDCLMCEVSDRHVGIPLLRMLKDIVLASTRLQKRVRFWSR